MMLAGFLFLLLVTDGSTYNYSEDLQPKDHRNNVRVLAVDRSTKNPNCSHRAVINFLDLKENNTNTLSRPGGQSSTNVSLDVKLFSILDVNEKEQQFVSYLWVDSEWYDEDMTWNPSDFCEIQTIYPSTKVVWMPDITIAEMTDTKDVASPYFRLYRNGSVFLRSNMVIFSNCPMEVYMFPFDVQKCNLTFKSIIHEGYDLVLKALRKRSEWNTVWSLENMAESEWLLVNMTVRNETVNNFFLPQSVLVYTITMKRRSALYIANFLLPILFFLCLDLTSFLIPDNGGEKLGFKVTVLLAVTVMQLILNDILPSSSNRIPLIAIYCIGVFGLMMLSLLETILMMYLLAKDSASQDDEAETDQSLSDDCEDKVAKANCCTKLKKWTPCASVSKASVDETPSEQLSVTTEGNSSKPTVESIALEKISDELKEVEKTLTLCDSRKKEKKLGYWAKVAKIFNLVFFICYVIAVIAFLTVLFLQWNKDDEK